MLKRHTEYEIINQNLGAARRGKKKYKEILKKFHEEKMRKIDDWGSAVLLFPSHDDGINYYGLSYVDEFLFRTNVKRLAIITTDKKVLQAATELFSRTQDIYLIDENDMNDILLYYRLYPFDNRIKVISLDEPLGRRADNLIGVKNITKEMLIAIGIYCLIPFERLTIKNGRKRKIMSIFNEEYLYEHR